jgi:DNA-binding NarL/FixJ family response regulator
VSSFRILLVEDFEPFRRFVRLALELRAEFNVVDEATDGLEAIQKAKHLQPDLILLDLRLPTMSGMEAATQIRIVAPDAKLLFVSLESSSAVVQEAFRVGARGYVNKLQVDNDLIPAIEAVLAGKLFVSGNLEFSDTSAIRGRHEVQFYSDDEVFLEGATRFVATALKAGSAVIVLATKSHRESLIQRLKANGFDMERTIQQGTYISLDGAEALSRVILNGLPDRVRFFEIVSGVIESAVKAAKTEHVAFLGEGAGLLCAEGNISAAIEIEKIANDLQEKHTVDIMCPYPLSAFGAGDDGAVQKICAEHTAVFPR